MAPTTFFLIIRKTKAFCLAATLQHITACELSVIVRNCLARGCP